MVVEVMGRYAGWIALNAGVSGTADVILIPEIPYDLAPIAEKIQERYARGRTFAIVVVAEGARPKGGGYAVVEKKAGSAERLGGVGERVAAEIGQATGRDTRVVVLGHLLRGGSPTTFDRLISLRFGAAAVRALAAGKTGVMVALDPPTVRYVPLAEAHRADEDGAARLRHGRDRPRARASASGTKASERPRVPRRRRLRRSSARTRPAWTASRRSCASGSPRRAPGAARRRVRRHREQGKLLVRERVERLLDPGTPFLEIGALAGYGMLRGPGALRRPRLRHRPRARPRGHGRRQRRHGEGRHLLPDHGQEAPAGPGDRAREPPALRLPRRLGRRLPAAAGRGLPRPRPLRAHLLQPGADERRSASRRSASSSAPAPPAAPTCRR